MGKISYTIDVKKTEKEAKKRIKRAQFKRRMSSIGKWISNNKELVIILGPSLIGLTIGCIKAGSGIVKSGVSLIKTQQEKKVKDFYCYDRSLGHYWALKRELTNREWVEIDNRKKNGERMADILDSLRVLK